MSKTIVRTIMDLEESSEDHVLAVMDQDAGDNKTVWDPEDEDSIELARMAFNQAKRKGLVGYEVGKKGQKGKVMKEFDPDAGKVIMAPALVGG